MATTYTTLLLQTHKNGATQIPTHTVAGELLQRNKRPFIGKQQAGIRKQLSVVNSAHSSPFS